MDWRFQVAELDGTWWVNHVGTYGMASAQLYWGRMAALLLRLLYRLFPQLNWGFVFVDDLAAAILATLLALGTPLSWKKTHLGEINTWLGFVVHPNVPRVQIAAPKFVIITELLDQLIQGTVFTSKSVERALGRLQTAACPLAKSGWSSPQLRARSTCSPPLGDLWHGWANGVLDAVQNCWCCGAFLILDVGVSSSDRGSDLVPFIDTCQWTWAEIWGITITQCCRLRLGEWLWNHAHWDFLFEGLAYLRDEVLCGRVWKVWWFPVFSRKLGATHWERSMWAWWPLRVPLLVEGWVGTASLDHHLALPLWGGPVDRELVCDVAPGPMCAVCPWEDQHWRDGSCPHSRWTMLPGLSREWPCGSWPFLVASE